MTRNGQVPGQDSSTLSRIEGSHTEVTGRSDSTPKEGASIPPDVGPMLAQFTQMRASLGPDPETAKIIAETERHSEDKRLEGYRATLDQRDRQSQRDQEYRMAQLKHSAAERRIVLFGSMVAIVVGGVLSLKGDPQLGNPIMSAALTVLITLLTGKLKIGD